MPLISTLSRPSESLPVDDKTEEERIPIWRSEKNLLDDIMVKYRHMFPPDITSLWEQKIRDQPPLTRWVSRAPSQFDFSIPKQFGSKIKVEYDIRVQEYLQASGRVKI